VSGRPVSLPLIAQIGASEIDQSAPVLANSTLAPESSPMGPRRIQQSSAQSRLETANRPAAIADRKQSCFSQSPGLTGDAHRVAGSTKRVGRTAVWPLVCPGRPDLAPTNAPGSAAPREARRQVGRSHMEFGTIRQESSASVAQIVRRPRGRSDPHHSSAARDVQHRGPQSRDCQWHN